MKVHIGIPIVIVLVIVGYFVYKHRNAISAKLNAAAGV